GSRRSCGRVVEVVFRQDAVAIAVEPIEKGRRTFELFASNSAIAIGVFTGENLLKTDARRSDGRLAWPVGSGHRRRLRRAARACNTFRLRAADRFQMPIKKAVHRVIYVAPADADAVSPAFHRVKANAPSGLLQRVGAQPGFVMR